MPSNCALELYDNIQKVYDINQEKAKKHTMASAELLEQVNKINQIIAWALQNSKGIEPEKEVDLDIFNRAKDMGFIDKDKTKLSEKEISHLIKEGEDKKQEFFKKSEMESSKISPLMNLMNTLVNIIEAVFKRMIEYINHIIRFMVGR